MCEKPLTDGNRRKGTVDAPLSFDAAVARITVEDPRFAVTEAVIRGGRYRVFANAPRHLRALFEGAADLYNGGDALVYESERWSYPALRRDVARLSNAMRDQLDLSQGDRVGLAMRNYPEMVILILAAAAAGIVVVPLNAWWTAEELTQAIEQCDLSVVFADGLRAERLAAAAAGRRIHLVGVRDTAIGEDYVALRDAADDSWPDAPIQPDDEFAILFSSGSTGFPKGVVQTHRNAISAVWSWLMTRAMQPLVTGRPAQPPADPPSWLIISPLFHVAALQANLLQGIANGAKISLMYKWDVDDGIRIIDTERITRVSGVPTQTADLAEAVAARGLRFPHLIAVGGGGAKRPTAQVGRLKQVFPLAEPGTGWGMTETNSLGITLSGDEYLANPDAAGRLTPPLQDMRIVNEDGRDVAQGEIGELLVRGPNVMLGYLNQPEATAEVLRDGWLYTGDLARIGPEGLVYLVDRKKHIVIRGGENISCLEIEDVLHDHPDILEASVFAVPHPRLGEMVGAAVYPRPGSHPAPAEILARLGSRLAKFKLPERIWIKSAPLPRSATDKIDRAAVRRDCLTSSPPGVESETTG